LNGEFFSGEATMITTPQLLAIVGREYAWFDSLRRRAARQFTLVEVQPGQEVPTADMDEALLLPIKFEGLQSGRWVRYDLTDTLLLLIAVELEKAGLAWRHAVMFALEAEAVDALKRPAELGDHWAALLVFDELHRRVVTGSIDEIAGHLARHAGPGPAIMGRTEYPPVRTVITYNVSAAIRDLRERAVAQGVAAALGLEG